MILCLLSGTWVPGEEHPAEPESGNEIDAGHQLQMENLENRSEERAYQAMLDLPMGSFGNVASSLAKVDAEFGCAICLVDFSNEDDVA